MLPRTRSNARSKAILKSGETLVTSDHVLIETWTLLHHKLDRKAAERFWEGLRSGIAAIETVTTDYVRPSIGRFIHANGAVPSFTSKQKSPRIVDH
jgi:hypothetical protein